MHSFRGWIFTAIIAVACFAPCLVMYRSHLALAAQRDEASSHLQRLLAARAENVRLRRALVDVRLPDADEFNRSRLALANLQNDIAEESRALAAATGRLRARFASGSIVAAADWRNAGNATPEAALETALWAGAGGDVNALASLLRLSPAGRAAAESAFAGLSDELRKKYGTAEQWIAELTVPDVPLAVVRVKSWDSRNVEQTRKLVQLEEYVGADPKTVGLLFDRTDMGWKLLVPDDVVIRYVTKLKTGS